MRFEEHIPLAPRTTFRIGGTSRYFCEPTTEGEVREALSFARERGVPLLVLGGGSNMLVGDGEFLGLVMSMGLRGIRDTVSGDSVTLEVGAGESWDEFVRFCVDRGYWGAENLSLIPGTVGASPVQNIGAYGVEVKDLVESVSVIDSLTGEGRVLSNAECAFAYRDSVFKSSVGKHLIITSVTFKLSTAPRPNLSYKDLKEYFAARNIPDPSLRDIREATIAVRRSKFPDLNRFGTAGSFWKNPIISADEFARLKAAHPLIPSYPAGERVKVPLAWILDNVCGLKGYAQGKVCLFRNQPLVLTVEFGATAAEVQAFAAHIEAVVLEKTGITIEREVNMVLC